MSAPDTTPHNPRDWPALANAAALIADEAAKGTAICVWGHDDIDGAAGTAILSSVLGGTGSRYYVPPKGGAHYGLDTAVIDQLVGTGVGLIVTVDCGISSAAEAEYARSKGIGLVITDHHELPASLPRADAIVNPKIREKGAPCASLSGSGVALYLAALIAGTTGNGWLTADPKRLSWAALATVSDRVPLREENREILKAGLPCLAADPVFAAVAAAIGLDLSRGLSHRIVSEHFVALLSGMRSEGFSHPAVELMRGAVNPALVRELWASQQEWRARLDQETGQKKGRLNPVRDNINLVVDEQLELDMVGPLAGKLRDATGFPAVVIGLRNGLHVGECRGFEPFDFTAMLRALTGYFIQAGGHKQAAGFTVKPDKLGETLVAIEEYAENHKGQIQAAIPQLTPAHRFASIDEIGALAQTLNAGAPYGPGNPGPVCEIASFLGPGETGSLHWLDDVAARVGTGTRTVTAMLDTTHTGHLSIRILS